MTNHKNLKVLVFGAGAIGSYFGGRLAQSGNAEVAVVCRSDYEHVKTNGYQINSIKNDFHFMPSGVYRNAADYPGTPDLLIVATKVLPDSDIAGLIAPAVGEHTVLMLIQNGLGMEEEMQTAFPDHEIFGAIAYIGVCKTGRGVIEHQGGGKIQIGRFPEGSSPILDILTESWLKTGVECRQSNDIIKDRWAKLVWNAPYNPISILAGGLDTGKICADPQLDELCATVMNEVCVVAKACGKELPATIIQDNLNYTHNFPPYKTSMLVDYENSRPLEVEAILGSIVRRASEKKVAVPHLRTIYALLKSVNLNHCHPIKT